MFLFLNGSSNAPIIARNPFYNRNQKFFTRVVRRLHRNETVIPEIRIIPLVRMSMCANVEPDPIIKHCIEIVMQFDKAIMALGVLSTADHRVMRRRDNEPPRGLTL
jgi:hypothetical protein